MPIKKLQKQRCQNAKLRALRRALTPFANLLGSTGLDQIGGGTIIAPDLKVQWIKDAQRALSPTRAPKAPPVTTRTTGIVCRQRGDITIIFEHLLTSEKKVVEIVRRTFKKGTRLHDQFTAEGWPSLIKLQDYPTPFVLWDEEGDKARYRSAFQILVT